MSEAQTPVVRRGLVSVVLVNYRGATDTLAALTGLAALDWPAERLELIVVDNASGDGSEERLRAEAPRGTVVVAAGANLGFAGGCNLGVGRATGEYVAFLNNDARPHPRWVAEAVRCFEDDADVAAVASKVLDWEGKRVDFVDGSLTWFGMGYKREVEQPDMGAWDEPKDVLFGTGAAMFVRAATYRAVGGFDERFFMFYEDVDLGWRLNLLGYRFRYVPTSVAYHRHHVTMNKFGSFREEYLLERNALFAMYKNYDDESLAAALPAALALAVRRSFARGEVDTTALDLQRSPGGDDVSTVELPKRALAGPFAVDALVTELASLTESRRELQAARRHRDRELFPLFRVSLEPAYGAPSYLRAHDTLVEAFGIAERLSARHRVLVVTGEPVGEQMAGPAIRAWEIATALAAEHEVRLLSTAGVTRSATAFAVEYAGTAQQLRELTEWADLVIFQGFLLDAAPWLVESSAVLVADVYDPMHLEQLEQARDQEPEVWAKAVASTTAVLNNQLRRADYLLCASDRQRDFWLGQLAGQGRVNPAVYAEDETLQSLVAVVPFGIPDALPVQRRHAIKGARPGIGPDDKVILWGGGVYNWFDPLTLVRAVDRLRRTRPDVRLYFLGMKHPNPGVPRMRMATELYELSDRLGLTDRYVFFNTDWVPYAERADYLLDADIGVSTHPVHVETAFSFRTRILDYLWAGLPVVATEGDVFAGWIAEHGLGRVVRDGDDEGLAGALEELLYDAAAAQAARDAVVGFRSRFLWSTVLEPLVRFARNPRRAPDLLRPVDVAARSRRREPPRSSVRGDVALFREYLRQGGVGEVTRRAAGRVRRVVTGKIPED